MPSFDIMSISDFNPARYACPVCRGLISSLKAELRNTLEGQDMPCRYCPVCQVDFIKGQYAPDDEGWAAWFREQDCVIGSAPELFDHARSMAQLVRKSRADSWPTMRLISEVLSRARHFVHFASWGMSHEFVGMFKLTSMRVPVYGFVANPDNQTTKELTKYPAETPRLYAEVVSTGNTTASVPHQKLIVVDGLLVFEGSANLNQWAMRKADEGWDTCKTITDIQAVIDFNNRYFARVWKDITARDRKEVVMWETPF